MYNIETESGNTTLSLPKPEALGKELHVTPKGETPIKVTLDGGKTFSELEPDKEYIFKAVIDPVASEGMEFPNVILQWVQLPIVNEKP